MEFFKLGKEFTERALFGGNRCLTPWTKVSTDRGERPIGEVASDSTFYVQTLAGETLKTTRAEGVFLKCIEPAFRIHLDNGRVFECSRMHRVWTPGGWCHIRDLLASRVGVLHWSRTLSGWTANYDADGHPYGQRLRSIADTARELLLTLDGAQKDIHGCSRPDASGRRRTRNRVYRAFDRRAIRDVAPHLSDLNDISVWECPAAMPSALPTFPVNLVDGTPLQCTPQQLAEWQAAVLRLVPDQGTDEVWLPCDSLLLWGQVRIIAVEAIGLQPIVDFTVPETANYMAAGVIHHNTGKTHCGCYEDALHLTGLYPDWWPGRRFDHPVNWWAATDTAKNTRDILQDKYCGKPGDQEAQGTGMIPGDLILRHTPKHGLADAYESIFVRHVPTGGVSTIQLKSYDQGRVAFQGTRQHGIHLDEEPDISVYTECLLRLMSTNLDEEGGILLLTETPLLGISDLMIEFMPQLKPEPDLVPDDVWNTQDEEEDSNVEIVN